MFSLGNFTVIDCHYWKTFRFYLIKEEAIHRWRFTFTILDRACLTMDFLPLSAKTFTQLCTRNIWEDESWTVDALVYSFLIQKPETFCDQFVNLSKICYILHLFCTPKLRNGS